MKEEEEKLIVGSQGSVGSIDEVTFMEVPIESILENLKNLAETDRVLSEEFI